MRGPTQLSTLLYSQLILRICVATNGLGGGAQTDWVGAPKLSLSTGAGNPRYTTGLLTSIQDHQPDLKMVHLSLLFSM